MRSLRLEPVDGAPLPDCELGQFLALKLRPRRGRAPLVRSYSLAAAPDPRDAGFYLCGPPSFLHELTAALLDWGVDPGRLRRERFGPEPRAGAPAPHPPAASCSAAAGRAGR